VTQAVEQPVNRNRQIILLHALEFQGLPVSLPIPIPTASVSEGNFSGDQQLKLESGHCLHAFSFSHKRGLVTGPQGHELISSPIGLLLAGESANSPMPNVG
jgi:hypothetical protein